MPNVLNTEIDFQIVETSFGTWRRYLYPSGALYSEFQSHSSFAGIPLVHIARGRSPVTGKIATARGMIAIGQKAVGVVAIGQASCGVVAVGQLAVGLLVGVGQAATGLVAVGQVAAGILTIAQFGAGLFGVAQSGVGPLRKF